jgi:hypothetical protein
VTPDPMAPTTSVPATQPTTQKPAVLGNPCGPPPSATPAPLSNPCGK